MSFSDLRGFVAALEARGQLARVSAPVSTYLEMAALADRLVKSGGPAVLFEKPVDRGGKRFAVPVVMNLFGTRERMALALGVERLDDIGERITALADVKVGGGLMGLLANLPKLREVASLPPKRVRSAPAQQVVLRGEAVDLTSLPVLTTWPQDGGPFVTLPLVVTRDPVAGDLNIGMYRMQVLDARSTAMHWQRHKTGARHAASAKALGKRLEVAVALGGDPALIYAATAPLPPVPGLSEYSLTGFLRGKQLEVVRGVTVDLEVPANAEIVLEGYVDPEEEPVVEGPFGDHTGYYTLPDLYPRFHVTAVTMREEPIYPATVVGRPPMEDAYLIEASERIFLAPARFILPEIVDYHMPPAGIAHNLVNVAIEKSYPGQAYKVANGLLGLGQMMLAKVILVGDAGEDVRDHLGFWRAVLAGALPGRDSQFSKGPIDVLDHSSRSFSYGSKLVIDGTRKAPEEAAATPPYAPNPERGAAELPAHPDVIDQHQVAGGFWFITARKERPGQGRELAEWAAGQPAAEGVRLIAVLDDACDPRDFDECVWTMLNNIDPERDVQVVRASGGAPTFAVDASPKLAGEGFERDWPEKLTMPAEVLERVDELWAEVVGR